MQEPRPSHWPSSLPDKLHQTPVHLTSQTNPTEVPEDLLVPTTRLRAVATHLTNPTSHTEGLVDLLDLPIRTKAILIDNNPIKMESASKKSWKPCMRFMIVGIPKPKVISGTLIVVGPIKKAMDSLQ